MSQIQSWKFILAYAAFFLTLKNAYSLTFGTIPQPKHEPLPERIRSYNSIIQCPDTLTPPASPETLSDLQSLVRSALAQNYTLKPFGSLHTSTDLICTDGVPVSMRQINHFSYNAATKEVTIGAGSTLSNLLEQLHLEGRTITGFPMFSGITVGGALGCGAHGSNLRQPGTVSDQVTSLRIVDGRGDIRNISDSLELRAFKAHLGLLGIVYEITLKTLPQFKYHMKHTQVSDDILWNGKIFEYISSSDRFQFWWFPTAKRIILSEGIRVPLNTPGNCRSYIIPESPRSLVAGLQSAAETMQEEHDHLGFHILQIASKLSLVTKVAGRSPIYTEDGKSVCTPAIGYSHRMTSNECFECAWDQGNVSLRVQDFEAEVPLGEFKSALKTLRKIFEEYPVELPLNGVFVRFVKGSDGLLTTNGGRDSANIEWVLAPRADRFGKPMMGTAASHALSQALLQRHRGRMHWGKNGLYYVSNYRIMRNSFENLPTFVKLMKKFDPHGVFLNDFGKRMIDPHYTKTSIDNFVKHCGLVDHCVCQKDEDCGDGSTESYKCGKLLGYNVCRERDVYFKVWKNRREKYHKFFRADVVRDLISKWNP